jgi:hypothetical protein
MHFGIQRVSCVVVGAWWLVVGGREGTAHQHAQLPRCGWIPDASATAAASSAPPPVSASYECSRRASYTFSSSPKGSASFTSKHSPSVAVPALQLNQREQERQTCRQAGSW